jgi:hypothetical protein
MIRVLLLLVAFAAGPAAAQTCPDFFRFVEFGQEDPDGTLRSGGTVLRGIDGMGAPILQAEATICRTVPGLRVDGRGNAIPVVAETAFDPALLPLDVAALRIWAHADIAAVTQAAAARHRMDLARVEPRRGEGYLCIAPGDRQSCQVASPYGSEHPLVVYCDADFCQMSALAFDDRVLVDAAWSRDAESSSALGPAILAKVEALRRFLADHLSGAER